jgi:hypothetical protein
VTINIFRDLTIAEVQNFRRWARDNWKPGDKIGECWHPVVQKECEQIQAEYESRKRGQK